MFDEQESGLFSNKGLLKYEQAISLQTICAVNIVANLWKNEKVELENKFYEFGSEIKHRDIIFSKINRLHLPRVITGHLVSVIEFVGNALKSWIEFHDKYLFDYDPGMDDSETDYNEDYMDNSKVEFDDDDHMYDLETKKRRDSQSTKYLNLIKFTNNGTIDQMQTAKNILINETNLELKYKLASHYCLEEEIQNIPAAIKNDFCKRFVEEFCMSDDLDLDENPVLFYWTYHTVDAESELPTCEAKTTIAYRRADEPSCLLFDSFQFFQVNARQPQQNKIFGQERSTQNIAIYPVNLLKPEKQPAKIFIIVYNKRDFYLYDVIWNINHLFVKSIAVALQFQITMNILNK